MVNKGGIEAVYTGRFLATSSGDNGAIIAVFFANIRLLGVIYHSRPRQLLLLLLPLLLLQTKKESGTIVCRKMSERL